ncbi:hypothetical protein BDW59DRAFT_149646 [Aspergillus cavernicola]|uniref:Uncharacterized protein n=1 Tax=Aspergillus cavernicola TaxID=176166 RepID=A0ABR4I3E4_9EURO
MPDTDDSSLTNALSAVSTLIGYIGTEVATSQCFNRVVWPQRSYNNFTIHNAWKAALLMPLGGPLQTAALQTIDGLFKNGLMRGPRLGHMLGTCFFPDSALEYQLYENGARCGVGHVRNGIWPRILGDMPMMATRRREDEDEEQRQEDSCRKLSETRQRTPVSHLSIIMAESDSDSKKPVLIEGDIDTVTLWTILAIITSEITGLAVSIIVATVWKSAWMVIWLVPLILKLIAAYFAVPRHRFTPETLAEEEPSRASFYLENGQGIQIIEGPIHIVRPFFRHYGHPKRQRWNEIVQIAVVIAFGINFPVGLVVSILCMPVPLQCMWTGYVLYVTIALYVSRYTHGASWLTTEERISRSLIYAEEHPGQTRILFKAAEDCILCVELSRTMHNSFGLAKEHAFRILQLQSKAETPLPCS